MLETGASLKRRALDDAQSAGLDQLKRRRGQHLPKADAPLKRSTRFPQQAEVGVPAYADLVLIILLPLHSPLSLASAQHGIRAHLIGKLGEANADEPLLGGADRRL